MTKMIKMSLIAAVAVTGLTTTVSAQPLEDAIKGVDFSGNLRYRHNDGEANVNDQNEYKLQLGLKAKVNDMVTATVSTDTIAATSDTTTKGDADPVAAYITEANFAVSIAGNTIIAGKQALATPFADGGAASDAQQGTGVVALVPVAGVTVAAGLYLNSDASTGVYGADLGANNIAALAVIGKASVVDYAAWYANVSETDLGKANGAAFNGATAGATALNLNVKAPVGPVNVEVNYAKVDYTLNAVAKAALTTKDLSPSQSRIVVSGDVAGVSLAAGYVKTGKDGGDVTLGDTDATANFVMEAFSASAIKDTNAFYLAASMPVGPVTAKVEYGTTSDVDGTTAGDVKFSETKLSVAYAMSKNFTISGFIANDSSDNAALDKADTNRIELSYTF